MDTDFKPIFEYLDGIKAELKADISRVETKTDNLLTSVDNLAKVFKEYHEEQKIYVHKLNRIEEWIKQAATKLGLDYKP